MDEAQDDKHCSVISMIKKACEILKQFVIKKPIQADNDNLATSDELHFMKNVDSQLDFIFDIRSPRTNFSSQSINYIDNQDDDELIMTPDMETGLIG